MTWKGTKISKSKKKWNLNLETKITSLKKDNLNNMSKERSWAIWMKNNNRKN